METRSLGPRRIPYVGAVILGVIGLSWIGLAAEQAKSSSAGPSTASAGIFTSAQAAAGKAKYNAQCGTCHHSDLLGDGGCVPSLVGQEFFQRWDDKTVDGLFDALRNTMPPASPRSLSPGDYADLVAFVLSENGFPPGARTLPPQPEALRTIKIRR